MFELLVLIVFGFMGLFISALSLILLRIYGGDKNGQDYR